MKINKEFKIESATSTDHTRQPLQSIFCFQKPAKDGKFDSFAAATDGKILAIVPIELEDGELKNGNSIEAVDLKFQRSNPAVKKQDYVFASLKPLDGQYPDIEKPQPSRDRVTVSIGINVKLLNRLADALGTDVVKMSIIDGETAFIVEATNSKAHGLIMPVRLGK